MCLECLGQYCPFQCQITRDQPKWWPVYNWVPDRTVASVMTLGLTLWQHSPSVARPRESEVRIVWKLKTIPTSTSNTIPKACLAMWPSEANSQGPLSHGNSGLLGLQLKQFTFNLVVCPQSPKRKYIPNKFLNVWIPWFIMIKATFLQIYLSRSYCGFLLLLLCCMCVCFWDSVSLRKRLGSGLDLQRSPRSAPSVGATTSAHLPQL